MAGANSIFAGDKLLTTPNPSFEEDNAMFELLGLKPREAFKERTVVNEIEKDYSKAGKRTFKEMSGL